MRVFSTTLMRDLPLEPLDNALVKAQARAFRWRKLLDERVYATLEDLAKAKGIGKTYVSQILRLTLLAPEIVEAILDGRQPVGFSWMICYRGFRWRGRIKRPGGSRPPHELALHPACEWRLPGARHVVRSADSLRTMSRRSVRWRAERHDQ